MDKLKRRKLPLSVPRFPKKTRSKLPPRVVPTHSEMTRESVLEDRGLVELVPKLLFTSFNIYLAMCIGLHETVILAEMEKPMEWSNHIGFYAVEKEDYYGFAPFLSKKDFDKAVKHLVDLKLIKIELCDEKYAQFICDFYQYEENQRCPEQFILISVDSKRAGEIMYGKDVESIPNNGAGIDL